MNRIVRTLLPATMAIALAFTGGSVSAQDAAPEEKEPGPLVGIGEDLWRTANVCWDCHGNLGNGRREDPRSAVGANFRESILTAEQIAEVIRCGRIGSVMPYFGGRRAYEGDNSCYGVTLEQLGDQAPPQGNGNYNARQAEALGQFIWWYFVGRGPVTEEECYAFYGANASSCARWPTEAELAAGG